MVKQRIKILMVSGKKYSGKDTIYELIRNLDSGAYRVAFADQIKAIAGHIVGSSYNNNPDNKEALRPLWIKIGEMGREYNKYVWTSKVVQHIRTVVRQNRDNNEFLFVVTDFRFPEEYEALCDAFGAKSITTIRVHRDSEISRDHYTETLLDNFEFDYVIDNNSTRQNLMYILHRILKGLRISAKKSSAAITEKQLDCGANNTKDTKDTKAPKSKESLETVIIGLLKGTHTYEEALRVLTDKEDMNDSKDNSECKTETKEQHKEEVKCECGDDSCVDYLDYYNSGRSLSQEFVDAAAISHYASITNGNFDRFMQLYECYCSRRNKCSEQCEQCDKFDECDGSDEPEGEQFVFKVPGYGKVRIIVH